MELKVYNISRHVPQSTVRILFSILGDILFFDYYSSVSRRDGTFECVIIYRELSEAQLAAKLDGTELGDRCLEVRLSQNVDRYDIGFTAPTETPVTLSSRTLLIKCEDLSCDQGRILNDFNGIFRVIELERDLGTGLPSLSARFYLAEFSSIEDAENAIKNGNSSVYTVSEAQKHIHTSSVSGNSAAQIPTGTGEEVLIYGVPASKLLDPTTARSYSKSSDDYKLPSSSSAAAATATTRSSHRSRSRSRSRSRYDRDDYRYRRDRSRDRSRDYDRHRRRRSRSRSGERRRR